MITQPEIMWSSIFGIVGYVISVVVQRLRNSMSVLRWNATFFNVANSKWSTPDVGPLVIELAGVSVTNLWQSNVEVTNESGRDLDSFEIEFNLNDLQIIVHDKVAIDGQPLVFKSTARAMDIAEKAATIHAKDEKSDAEQNFVNNASAFRGYIVPGLNRNQKIIGTFLINTSGEERPHVSVSSPSSGIDVQVKPYIAPIRNEIWGIPVLKGAKVGVPISIGVIIGLYYLYGSPGWLLVVSVVMAGIWTITGLFILRILRFLRSLFT